MVEDISILGGKISPLKYPKGMVEDISAEYKEEG